MEAKQPNKAYLIAPVMTAGFLAFIYFYPRMLVKILGLDNPWTNYLYHYGFGVVFFGIGIFILLRSGAGRPGRGRDSFWIKFLIVGLILYSSVHLIWMLLAQNLPFLGD